MQTVLSPLERQNRIAEMVAAEGRLQVAGLASLFQTSDDSIRRDLRALAADGRIRRLHGVVLPAAPPPDSFAERDGQHADEKAAIGRALVPLLRPGSTVFFDGGTTTLAAARAMPTDLALSVVTTSPPVALALVDHPGVEVILVGGTFDRASRTVVGALAVEAIRAVRADAAVLGLCSLSPGGVSTTGLEEAAVKRAMADSSARCVALGTADKLGLVSPHMVMPAEQLDTLITCAAPADRIKDFVDIGVDVISAPL
ncbi:DeoR family transcriptional regulator [Chthonobacter rhizosphaerae]|uniref:DeoR family transcriptional regulator n=1 Tax=Chthonobacter rhizosphaerae TaxID=2735553 RepID=UPI0015EE4A5F